MTVDTRYTTLGMVAFLDLLGYSARVLAIQTVDDLKAIERDVRHVQQWFDYAAKDEGVRDVHKMQGKRVLAFSDCLVITVPSFSELAGSEGDFDVQLGEIVALGYAQGRCVMNGVFIEVAPTMGFGTRRGTR